MPAVNLFPPDHVTVWFVRLANWFWGASYVSYLAARLFGPFRKSDRNQDNGKMVRNRET